MHIRSNRCFLPFLALLIATQTLLAGAQFRVAFPNPLPQSESGLDARLIVFVNRDDGPRIPLGELVFEDPQPLYSIPITNAQPEMEALVADQASSFPDVPSALPPGKYRAMAVLRRTRANSNWRIEPGNLFSDEVDFTIRTNGPTTDVRLVLTGITGDSPPISRALNHEPVEHIEIESEALARADGAIGVLRAIVLPPKILDPDTHYPTLYHIQGFGGDFRVVASMTGRQRLQLRRGSTDHTIHHNAFHVFLDAEGPFGHHLFADSANNGPVATTLVSELIPEIESRHPQMRRDAEARILTGHSSGAWASIWLVLKHSDTFGACFVTAPDPIDFRSFQNTDIYTEPNMYFDDDGRDKPVYRKDGSVLMTVRQENLMERAIGPGAWGAQQWASWHAIFGPRASDDEPALLFDQLTGEIDPAIAQQWRLYDMSALLRDDPERFLPIWRDRIRMVIGTQDAFYLERPARLLWQTIADLSAERSEPAISHHGVPAITFAPDHSHSTVRRSDEAARLTKTLADRLESLVTHAENP